MKAFQVLWNASETVFYEMLWKKYFTVYSCFYTFRKIVNLNKILPKNVKWEDLLTTYNHTLTSFEHPDVSTWQEIAEWFCQKILNPIRR